MNRIVLHGASHLRLPYPYLDPDMPMQCSSAVLGNLIGRELKALRDRVSGFEDAEAVVCSTIVSPLITELHEYSAPFKEAFQQHMGGAFPAIVSAYQCATWGYVLRYYSQLKNRRRLAISIADVDLHQFRHWTRNQVWNELWGNTGFGITSLLVEFDACPEDELLASGATGKNALLEFARAMKAHSQRFPSASLSIPFFPENTRQTLYKFLGDAPVLPHFHHEYGHCFGSDPWIALIKHFENGVRTEQANVLAASFALNGYFTVANITVACAAPMHFSTYAQ